MQDKTEKLRRLALVARRYYLEDKKQSDIAAELGVSRPLISRMLSEARELGVVEITIHAPGETAAALLRRLSEPTSLPGGPKSASWRRPWGRSRTFCTCPPWRKAARKKKSSAPRSCTARWSSSGGRWTPPW